MKIALIIFVVYAFIVWILRKSARVAGEAVLYQDFDINTFNTINNIQSYAVLGLIVYGVALIIMAIVKYL